MGHKNKPRILDDDIELMIRIARHGFVDMDYIQLFAYEGRKKETIDRRILQLALHDFLIIERSFPNKRILRNNLCLPACE